MNTTRQVSESLVRSGKGGALRPLAMLCSRSRALMKESQSPSAGIFYILLSPDKTWEVYSYRFDEFPEEDHVPLWEGFIAPVLARRWRKPEVQSANHPYAFPRGRVIEDVGHVGKWRVMWGEDFPPSVSKNTVARHFSLPPGVEWESDDHERCQGFDVRSICSIFGIKPTWKYDRGS